MERKTCSLKELYESGRLRRGMYIDYVSDNAIYDTNPDNTGCEQPQHLDNSKKVNYRVAYFDEETETLAIMPDENPIKSLILEGTKGYMNGPKEIDNVCSIFGNSRLGAVARGIRLEDIEKITGNFLHGFEERYAFYPWGKRQKVTIDYEGNSYKKARLSSMSSKFYTYDSGGRVEFDEYGFVYRNAEADNPVFVTITYNGYCKTNLFFGTSPFWLASQCVIHYARDIVGFGMRYVRKDVIGAFNLCHSGDITYKHNRGIRPLVILNSVLKIDITDETLDGSTPEKALKFAAEEGSFNEMKKTKEPMNFAESASREYSETQETSEEKTYKLVYSEAKSVLEAIVQLENEVNRYIAEGYECVGSFKRLSENDTVIYCQQLIKK